MAEPHVVSALKHKRGQIAGEIIAVERRINDLRAALVHVDATLKLFLGEGANPEAIPPRLPRPEPSQYLPVPSGRGDTVRAILDVLRQAGVGLTAVEVVERTAERFGVPVDAAKERRHPYRVKVETTLYRQKDRGVIVAVKDGSSTLWRVPD